MLLAVMIRLQTWDSAATGRLPKDYPVSLLLGPDDRALFHEFSLKARAPTDAMTEQLQLLPTKTTFQYPEMYPHHRITVRTQVPVGLLEELQRELEATPVPAVEDAENGQLWVRDALERIEVKHLDDGDAELAYARMLRYLHKRLSTVGDKAGSEARGTGWPKLQA